MRTKILQFLIAILFTDIQSNISTLKHWIRPVMINLNCEKFELDCDFKIPNHGLKASKEIPIIFIKSKNKIRFNSYICSPKYKGEGGDHFIKRILISGENVLTKVSEKHILISLISRY